MRKLLVTTALSVVLSAFPVVADDINELRQELEQTKALVKKLEARLQKVEKRAPAAKQAAVTTAPPPAPIEGAKSSDNAFNPAISGVLMGGVNSYSRNPDNTKFKGFAMGGEAGLPNRGFSLGESELTLASNIDDMFYGALTASIAESGSESEISLEEAYIETLALPYGTKVKAGRFFPVLGYMNEIHAHADSFVDRPLPYRAFLGGGNFSDDGVQVSVVLPTSLFTEVGGGAYHGSAFPAADGGQGNSAQSAFARVGGDIGVAHSWLAGVSFLRTQSTDRTTDDVTFNGDTNLYILDGKYTWAPGGNATQRSLTLQGEYFLRTENGDYNALAYDRNSTGWYAQAVYKFDPQWKTGYRFASLNGGGIVDGLEGTSLDSEGHNPRSHSLLLEYDNSEFSSIRLQLNRDESDLKPNSSAMLWYTISMGTHGAHKY